MQNDIMFTACKNSQKWVKNQKSTDKHSSFDGLIQEDIDLSDIYLAVIGVWLKSKLLQLNKMSKEATNVNFMFQFDEHDIKNSNMKSI